MANTHAEDYEAIRTMRRLIPPITTTENLFCCDQVQTDVTRLQVDHQGHITGLEDDQGHVCYLSLVSTLHVAESAGCASAADHPCPVSACGGSGRCCSPQSGGRLLPLANTGEQRGAAV